MSKIFHYTTLETLILIIKNRTLRFNSLKNVDDCREGLSNDLGSFAEHIFVSSWTRDQTENPALWKMYSDLHTGVRIGIDSTSISYEKLETWGEKDVNTLIYPIQNTENLPNDYYAINWLNNDTLDTVIDIEYKDNRPKFIGNHGERRYDYICSVKDTYWKFQKECRFVLFGVKKSDIAEVNMNNLREFLSKGINLSSMELNYIDLQLTDYFFKNLEITAAPLMSDAYYDLLNNYLHNKISQSVSLQRSALKIRK